MHTDKVSLLAMKLSSLKSWQKQLLLNTIINVIISLSIIGVGILYTKIISNGLIEAKNSNNALVRYLILKADSTYSFVKVNQIFPLMFVTIGSIVFVACFIGVYGVLWKKSRWTIAFLTSVISNIVTNITTIILVYFHFYPVKRSWDDTGKELHNVIEVLAECCGFETISNDQYCRFSQSCGDKIFGGLISKSWLVMTLQGILTTLLFVNTIWLLFIIKFSSNPSNNFKPSKSHIFINSSDEKVSNNYITSAYETEDVLVVTESDIETIPKSTSF